MYADQFDTQYLKPADAMNNPNYDRERGSLTFALVLFIAVNFYLPEIISPIPTIVAIVAGIDLRYTFPDLMEGVIPIVLNIIAYFYVRCGRWLFALSALVYLLGLLIIGGLYSYFERLIF